MATDSFTIYKMMICPIALKIAKLVNFAKSDHPGF